MSQRTFWLQEIDNALKRTSIVWLAGVRRSGKTTLAKSLPGVRYYDCELKRVRSALDDPELFWGAQSSEGVVVLDEVHRLLNPSEVLKVAADHFPQVRVVATGSSTLAAKLKFRDSLTGRKRIVWLVPMTSSDLVAFGAKDGLQDLEHRMLRGGLPPFYLSEQLDDNAYEEWMTSYWAKDLSELFVVDKRAAFMKFVELLFLQSGGLFEAQSFTAPCEISRQTVQNYLAILEATLLATIIRPFHGGSAVEIKRQPKVYAFDTGFVAYHRGWESLRDDDRGQLLEHLVLGEIAARFGTGRLHYWRDKQQHEVDFVLELGRRRELVAIECKSSAQRFDPAALKAFRDKHPGGKNYVVTLRSSHQMRKRFGDIEVEYLSYFEFAARLDELRRA